MKKLLFLSALFCFIGCQKESKEVTETTPALILENMDTTVSPAEDFFLYVNGTWLKNAKIPADRGRWGGFDELRKNNQRLLKTILEDEIKSNTYAPNTDQGKALQLYQVGMDTVAADKKGLVPIKAMLKEIENIAQLEDAYGVVAKMHRYAIAPLFSVQVIQDLKQSDIMAFYLFQGGLGLPNREYYTDKSEKFEEIRKKYVQHIQNMFVLYGKSENEAALMSQQVFELENKLAQVSWTPVEMRNLPKMYNKKSLKDLKEIVPFVDWQVYLNEIGISSEDSLIVGQPDFMEGMAKAVQQSDLKVLKNYMIWHFLSSCAPYLSQNFIDENFTFFGKEIRGAKELRPRWERVVSTLNRGVGFAVGKLYVSTAFPEEAKQKASTMVQNLLKAFKKRLQNIEWMSDSTKQQALKKLASFNIKIGYPDQWRNYEKLNTADSYVQYVLNTREFEFNRNIGKLGKPVDPNEWSMTPQQVNAYYHPLYNEIVFPAGILQPPFYNYKADEAVNYGGIGGVIGHEMTHGFDDSGSRFDAEGNMKNWWQEEDRKAFNDKAAGLVTQYSSYSPIDTMHVNGKLTLGENIADLGGLTVAYDALQLFYESQVGKPEPIDGFTAEQRFFLSWGTIWRTKTTDKYLRTQLKTDPHAPGKYRANGPLSNFAPFLEAFNIPEKAKMRREAPITIW